MNRRDFFKSTALGIGAMTLTSLPSLASTEIPLYKQFDWISFPQSTLFRINECNGQRKLVSVPVIAKTLKLKVTSGIDIDYTAETHTENISKDIKLKPRLLSISNYSQTYYTNELLLKEVQQAGITHIYNFVKYLNVNQDGVLLVRYGVRCVKMPRWKTVNGELQVVKVNNINSLD